MGKNLFIIGNGFDLNFGLSTRVNDLRNILKNYRIDYINALDFLQGYGVDWNEYEQSLSDIQFDELFENYYIGPDYFSDHESDRTAGSDQIQEITEQMRGAIKSALQDMISIAEEEISEIEQIPSNVFDDSIIINFNYTSTIEQVIQPQNILIYHIHGFYKKNEDTLQFGYKNTTRSLLQTNRLKNQQMEDEIQKVINNKYLLDDEKECKIEEITSNFNDFYDDYYIDNQREILNFSYEEMKKHFQYKELDEFLNNNVEERIDQIVVLGHSMADVDSEYMEILERNINPTHWIISQYNDHPDCCDLIEYSFCDKISFCKLDEYLVYN